MPKKVLPPKRKHVEARAKGLAAMYAPYEERRGHARWKQTYRRMMRCSLSFYATEMLRGPPETGGKFLLGKHHLAWSKAILRHDRLLSLAARDHGKSYFFCFAYPLWMIDRVAPGRTGHIFSASGKLAERHLQRIREEIIGGGENGIEGNPNLAHLLPFKKDNSSEIWFANGSRIYASGFESKVRGGHPWWVVGDDMGNDEWIWSETMRRKSIDYFLSAIAPMAVPGGQMIVVGTPFHTADLYAYLEETGVYHVSKYPARHPVTGKPLWPSRYDEDRLQFKRKELGSELRFSREYLCRPISDESSLFPSWLFDSPGIKNPYPLGLKAAHWEEQDMMTFVGVDLAMSANVGGDYLVVFVMAVDKRGNRWIVDIVRRKGLGYQEQVDLIVRVSKRYRASLVFCEANQFQKVISDMVIKESDVPIKAFYTTGRSEATTKRKGITQQATVSGNKNALDKGVPALRMLFENSKVRIPWSRETRGTVNIWIGEMQSFSWAEGKLQGVGSHDDTVMAMWLCEKAIEFGLRFSYDFMDDEEAAKLDLPDYWEDVEEDLKPTNEPETDFFGNADNGDDDDWRPIEGVGVSGPQW